MASYAWNPTGQTGGSGGVQGRPWNPTGQSSGIVQGSTASGGSGGGSQSNPWGNSFVSSNPADAYGQIYSPVANEAFRLYSQNQGFNPYQGSTVAPMGEMTLSGVNALGSMQSNPAIQQAMSFSGDLAAQGGMNDQQRMMLANGIMPVATGQQKIGTGAGYEEVYGRTQNGNPFFQEMLEGQLQDQQDALNRQFSGSGRYGSGAHADTMMDRLGNIRASTLYNQYNQDQQNALAALQGQTNVEGANIANQVGAAQTGVGLYDQGISRALQASSMLPGLETASMIAPQARIGAGQMFDNQEQQRMDSNIARYLDEQAAPWNRLQQLGNVTGAVSMPGQNLSYLTGQGQLALQQPSGVGQAIGTIGALGTVGNQLTGGALGEGIGSWLGGLFG